MRLSQFIILLFISFSTLAQISENAISLHFNQLPKRWDEALPLGNGQIGELIWQKDNKLRFSLDHAELWDLRPMKDLHTPGFNYTWVKEQVQKDNLKAIQKIGDEPYENEPAPSKLPGAALEFDMTGWGTVKSSKLNIEKAEAEVVWENGTRLTSFVHASRPIGYFRFENLKDLKIQLLPPKYEGEIDKTAGGSVAGDDLARLGYKQGKVLKNGQSYVYEQECWGGFRYQVSVKWKQVSANTIDGYWAISAHYPQKPKLKAVALLSAVQPYKTSLETHQAWWRQFWSKSSISLPDSVLEKQWYLEQYKFGSAARADTPPISLQAVWTADNGRLPPWKGDFHHDLNTQLSYWPAYSGNHLDEAMGYLNHLDQNKAQYKKYTQWFFGTNGLNVPGVTTLTGEEMGGWIQYSLSPTVSSWLAQHYYLQWRYSMDREFLEKRGYPWFKDVAKHLEQVTYKDASGKRQLPLSASPEIYENTKRSWFQENTNYDLALMKYLFSKAAELAHELKLTQEAKHYEQVLSEFGDYYLSENNELKFAGNLPYNQSHRHFSHLMAIHPLSEIRWENGAKEQSIIKNTIDQLEKIGPGLWCGYSYAWLGNLKTRAKDGEGAAKALKDFATAFCSINSFHLNGDQTKLGKSTFTYRPFTLEGNFAFAAGVQEMLLHSYAGFIEVFPAVPKSWDAVSFNQLRAEGAFLVSASKEAGQVDAIKIVAEKGGKTQLKLPFKTHFFQTRKGVSINSIGDNMLELTFEKDGELIVRNGYE